MYRIHTFMERDHCLHLSNQEVLSPDIRDIDLILLILHDL